MRNIGSMCFVVQHTVIIIFVVVVVFSLDSLGFHRRRRFRLIDTPQADVTLLIARRHEQHGIIRAKVQVRHALRGALCDVAFAQLELIARHVGHAGRRRLLRRLYKLAHRLFQRFYKRRIGALATILAIQFNIPARARAHGCRSELTSWIIRRAVGENDTPVPTLSIHARRKLWRNISRARRSARGNRRLNLLTRAFTSYTACGWRGALLFPRPDGVAERLDIQRLHSRLISRNVRLTLALKRSQSIVINTLVFYNGGGGGGRRRRRLGRALASVFVDALLATLLRLNLAHHRFGCRHARVRGITQGVTRIRGRAPARKNRARGASQPHL
mmetsp:Transcript_3862/g.13958  ORF Transcript_3862/g.13958 Transcript_3862/m.13958 type:complete len:330 (+) Transcript_3862:2255-3244(+)